MMNDASNSLLPKPRRGIRRAHGLIAASFAVLLVVFAWIAGTNIKAAVPVLSGGGPADAATAVAVDASVSIVSDVALSVATLNTSVWSSQTSGTSSHLKDVAFTDANTGWSVGASGVILKTTDAGSTWTAQTSGTDEDLFGVSFVDSNTGWAVGDSDDNAVIVTTTNGGTSWSAQTSGVDANLKEVNFVSTTTGWAVGGTSALSPLILSTTNGGTTWSSQSFTINKNGGRIDGASFVSTTTGWAVGVGGDSLDESGDPVNPTSIILKTIDGGSTWTQQTSGVTGTGLSDVHFVSTTTGWAVGSGGTALKTTDGGSTWSAQSGVTNYLTGVHFVDTSTGWIVGQGGRIFATVNGGTTWTQQTSGTSNFLNSVYFTSATTGWVAGDSGTILVNATTPNVLLQANTGNTSSGAASGLTLCTSVTLTNSDKTITCAHSDLSQKTWYTLTINTSLQSSDGDALAAAVTRSFQTAGPLGAASSSIANAAVAVSTTAATSVTFDEAVTLASLSGSTWNDARGSLVSTKFPEAVFFLDANTGWAATRGGEIWHTSDAGSTWTKQTSGTSEDLEAIQFLTNEIGYAIGVNGTILRTDTGGRIWAALSPGTDQDFTGMSFVDASTGWVVGGGAGLGSIDGVVLTTTDGGLTWTSLTYDADIVVAFPRDVSFIDANTGWAVGLQTNNGDAFYDLILKTTDGGQTWKTQTSPLASGNTTIRLKYVNAIDASTVYAGGEGGNIVKTTDGGTTWTALTTGTSSELWGMYFFDASTGWLTTSADEVRKTSDGGTTWSAQTTGATGTTAIHAASATVAYLTGTDNDFAFDVLKTTNGGTTWATSVDGVFGEIGLWDVAMPSATVAYAVGESGTIGKTTDAGNSWTIQTSGTTKQLRAISCFDISTCTIVGATGTILATTNGGTTWTSQTPVAAGASRLLTDVQVFSATVAYIAVNGNGPSLFMKTSDGGVTWVESADASTHSSEAYIDFFDTNTGWLVAGSGGVFKTTNGGEAWTEQTSGISTALYKVAAVSATTAYAAGGATSVLKTTDGGTTWTSIATGQVQNMAGINCADANTCWAYSGQGVIIKTTNGGTTWTAQTLVSDAPSTSLVSVNFFDEANAFIVGQIGSVYRLAPKVTLKTNTGNTSTGAATGTNYCNAVSLADSNTTVTCVHPTLASNTWYTMTIPSGASGIASATSQNLSADVTRSFRTAFAANYVPNLSGGSINNLVSEGFLSVVGTASAASQATASARVRSSVALSAGTAVVDIPSSTVITRQGGGTIDTTALTMTDSTSTVSNVTGSNVGAVQYGIPSVSLSFDTPVTISIPVNDSYNGRTLDVYRSSSTDFSGVSTLTTCVVANGLCTFTSTGASFFSISDPTGAEAVDVYPPKNVTGVDFSSDAGTITLIWEDPLDGDLKLIRVLRMDVTGGSQELGVVGPDVETYTDTSTDIIHGLPYRYRLQVEDVTGNRATSSSIVVFAVGSALQSEETTPPLLPNDIAISGSNGQIVLTWSDPQDPDFTTVHVYEIVGGVIGEEPIASVLPGTEKFVWASGSPGSSYTYKLRFIDANQNSVTSKEHAAVLLAPGEFIDTTPPKAPKDIKISGANGQVLLTWFDPGDADLNATDVYRIENGSAVKLVSTFPRTDRYIDKNVVAGATYTYELRTVDLTGNEGVSGRVSVLVEKFRDIIAPSVPSKIVLSGSNGQVKLKWVDPPEDDFVTMRIYRSSLLPSHSNYAPAFIASTTVRIQAFTDRLVDIGSTYTYELEALDREGNTARSAAITTTVIASSAEDIDTTAPSLPTNITIDGTPGMVVLQWSLVPEEDLVGVTVLRSADSYSQVVSYASVGRATSFIDSDVVVGLRYQYALEVTDVSGNAAQTKTYAVTVSAPVIEDDELTDEDINELVEEDPDDVSDELVEEVSVANAPCELSARERRRLIHSFQLTQKREPKTATDLEFLCALRTNPQDQIDLTVNYPTFRNIRAEILALKNFVNFFKRPPGLNPDLSRLDAEVGAQDWWAVKFMAYHLRLAPGARDVANERACIKLFFERAVDLYKDGVKEEKASNQAPTDLWDWDFIRACAYSGAPFLK
jgi:photosystem II stability/assembly factor-like uncharacterized protein